MALEESLRSTFPGIKMESPAPSGNSRREKKKKTKHRRRADEDAEPTNQHEETARTITYEQILQLPTFDPADDHDTMYNEDPFDSQLSRRRRNVQETAENKPLTKFYVENEISGEFFRVRFHPKRWSRLHDHSERSRSSTSKPGKEHEEHNQWSHGTLLRDVETALTLMCIGLLTGLSWLDALSLGAPDRFLADDAKTTFLCAYSSAANRSRQLFFILVKYPPQPSVLLN